MGSGIIDSIFGIALSLIAVAAIISALVISARTLASLKQSAQPRPRRPYGLPSVSDYSLDLLEGGGVYTRKGSNIKIVDGELRVEADDEDIISDDEDIDKLDASASMPLNSDSNEQQANDSSSGISGSEDNWQTIWCVPHNKSQHFFGRESLVDKLSNILTSGRIATLTQDFHIVGGAGRTQVAVEYAHSSADLYTLVWWLRAEEKATLIADYAALAAPLGMRLPPDVPAPAVCEAVRRTLERLNNWLLIFDNVSKPEDIDDFIPQGGNGHIIVTTRCPDWGIEASGLLPIKEFSRLDAADFLLARTRQTNGGQATALAEALGDLPLALEIAAAYINMTRTSITDYLKEYQGRFQDALIRGTSAECPAVLAAVIDMSLEQLESESPATLDLLRLCSFFSQAGIPISLLKEGASNMPATPPSAISDPVALNDAINRLAHYSLVEIGEDMLFIHSLVQAAMRDRLPLIDRQIWVDAAARVLDAILTSHAGDSDVSPECLDMLPHIIAVAKQLDEFHMTSEATVRLLKDLISCLKWCGVMSEARKAAEQALIAAENAYGAKHPWVAACAGELGMILRSFGNLKDARTHLDRALSIDELTYGPDHPNVAMRLTNLGSVLQELHDAAGAQRCYERALGIDETVYGPTHPRVADDAMGLGISMEEMGDYDGARINCDRSIKIAETAYGPSDLKITKYILDYGRILRKIGDPQAACEQFGRALQIFEEACGPNHLYVASCARLLGEALKELNDYQEACECFERALRIDESVYGAKHQQVAVDYNHLGGTMLALGNLAGARTCYQKSVEIDNALRSTDLLSSARYEYALGTVLKKTNEIQTARVHLTRAAELFTKSLGESHPETTAAQEALLTVFTNPADRHAA